MGDSRMKFKNTEVTGFENAILGARLPMCKSLHIVLPKENIEGVYEVTEAAEQFLREAEE